MALISFYLEKGISPEKIMKLGRLEKLFYIAVMENCVEKEKMKIKVSNPFVSIDD